MHSLKRYTKRLAPVGAAFALVATLATPVSAAVFSSIAVTPANPTAAAASNTWTVALGGVTTTSVQCLRLTIDTTGAFGSGGLPTGFAVTGNPGGTIVSAPGTWTGPTVSTNTVTWTNTGATFATGSRTLTFAAANPTAAGSYFLKVQTFTNAGCTTGGDVGTGGVVITDNTVVSVVVDPTLTFSVVGRATVCNGQDNGNFQTGSSGTAVSLGRINATSTGGGAQDLTLTTNASGGFTVYTRGTQATGVADMRSGTNVIADVASAGNPTAGTAAFGYTASDVQASNTFEPLTELNASVLAGVAGVQTDTGCVGFEAAASTSTPAGSYSATVVYTAVPTF